MADQKLTRTEAETQGIREFYEDQGDGTFTVRRGGVTAVSPANQVTTNSYAVVTGSDLDTQKSGARSIRYFVKETVGTNGITFKLQGSVDNSTFDDVIAFKADGTAHAAVDVAVTAGNGETLLVAPEINAAAAARSAYRYYRVQVKATSAGNQGTAQVRGFAK